MSRAHFLNTLAAARRRGPGRVKRVPNQYHLSVLAVLLRALTLPSVPQNQRDTLT